MAFNKHKHKKKSASKGRLVNSKTSELLDSKTAELVDSIDIVDNLDNVDNKDMVRSLPNNLEIPDIIPYNYDMEKQNNDKSTIYTKNMDNIKVKVLDRVECQEDVESKSKYDISTKMYINNYSNMDPIWMQMASNGMAILPYNMQKYKYENGMQSSNRIIVPKEFITPNIGIVTNYGRTSNNYKQSGINSLEKDGSNNCSKLFTKNMNCAFEGKNIDWKYDLFIVDLSYMTYKRFFATRTWYNIAFSENKVEKDHDWCKDVDFMAKFRKLFFKNLIAQAKSRNVPEQNIVFVIDCRHMDNWRVLSSNTYKSTRKESHIKNNFHNFDIFPIVRNELITDIQKRTGNMMFIHKNLEADDVIALMVKYIRKRKPEYNGSIFIIANDRDYIQICNDKTILIDLDGKAISNLANIVDGNSAKDYLLAKILMGDISDNITPCYFNRQFLVMAGIHVKRSYLKCTPSIVQQVMENAETRQKIIDMMNKCRLRICDSSIQYTDEEKEITRDNQFDYNARHMDFEHIPSKYASEINIIFMQCMRF